MQRLRLPKLTIRQIQRFFDLEKLNAKELATYCYQLATVGEEIWDLSAFAYRVPLDRILDQADRADHRRMKGKRLSLLDGIPVSVKQNIAVEYLPLTAGSRILGERGTTERNSEMHSDLPNIGYNADVVDNLLDGGAIIMGSTTMDEFGMGSLGTNVPSGNPTKNPLSFVEPDSTMDDTAICRMIQLPPDEIRSLHNSLDIENRYIYSTGGSSSGSAASIAHGSSLLSLGTDTGGSVRLPAAWCGVYGLKPSYGRLSRYGVVSYASSLDCVGLLGNSPECLSTGLQQLLTKPSSHDATHTYVPFDMKSDAFVGPSGLKIGIPESFIVEEGRVAKDSWLLSIDILEKLGAHVETIPSDSISVKSLESSLAAYYVIACAEASSNLARYDGFRYGNSVPFEQRSQIEGLSLLEEQYAASRTVGFGQEVARRVLCGTSVLSSDRFHTYFEAATRLRAQITKELRSCLDSYDALIVPTSVNTPPELCDSLNLTSEFANDVMTTPMSLAGLPSVACPIGKLRNERFSGSVQIVGPPGGEDKILCIAKLLAKGVDSRL